MSNAHINAVMTVMQLERQTRLSERKDYLRYKRKYDKAYMLSALPAIADELADCDHRLDELSKVHAKYY